MSCLKYCMSLKAATPNNKGHTKIPLLVYAYFKLVLLEDDLTVQA